MTTKWMGALTCALALPVLGLLAAQDRRQPEAVTDPAQAGPDYAIQGEYEGTLGEEGKAGAQVIAEGDGKFALRAYKGGLPGAGWDGRTDMRAEGKTEGGETAFTTNGRRVAVIAGGKLTPHEGGQAGPPFEKVQRKSPTLGAKPPGGAVVLFDGSSVEQWDKGKMTDDKLLTVFRTGPIRSKPTFKDFTVHIEFRLPYMPKARGQGRANSGVYLQDRYELQILDSFGLAGKNNECGGFYQQADPKVNMCLPPLVWQTYDIDFTNAVAESGKVVKKARMTVKHNGVVIHDDIEIDGKTGGARPEPEGTPGHLFLQGHGNPLQYRNIWVVEKK
jgi:Domain of Unknown Function (DUF1080)